MSCKPGCPRAALQPSCAQPSLIPTQRSIIQLTITQVDRRFSSWHAGFAVQIRQLWSGNAPGLTTLVGPKRPRQIWAMLLTRRAPCCPRRFCDLYLHPRRCHVRNPAEALCSSMRQMRQPVPTPNQVPPARVRHVPHCALLLHGRTGSASNLPRCARCVTHAA